MTLRLALPVLSGRVAVVTGANSGLGLAVTDRLAAAGATVVMACRSRDRAGDAREGLRTPGRAEIRRLDVTDPASIEAFADRFRADHDRLDVLINNAGVMMTPPERTAEGVELQWATNVLGPFALTGRLVDRLLATPDSRVVTVSSVAAGSGRLTGRDPRSLDGYRRFDAYAASKLGALVFAVELGRRLEGAGSSTVSAAAHPGLANTNLLSGIGSDLVTRAASVLGRALVQSADAGAEPIVQAGWAGGITNGAYLGPSGFRQYRGRAVPVALPPAAVESATGTRLWHQSAELTGIDYLG